MKDYIELRSYEEPLEVYDDLQKRLKEFFLKYLYKPLIAELDLPKTTLQNAKKSPLQDALFKGTVVYSGGKFKGKFNAQLSKQLRQMGAKFHKRSGTFEIEESKLPTQTQQLIAAGELNFQKKMQKLDRKLAQVVPEELTEHFKCEDIFDRTLFKADTQFKKNVEKVTITPELTKEQRAKISADWQDNMKLYIRDWTKDQIQELRKTVFEHVTRGGRKEALVPPIFEITKTIQKSHDQALSKAKFLAHQETRLMMATLKETRYHDAGIHEYIWRCVHRPFDMSPDRHTPGNVRYSHGQLNGKIFKFNDPPVTTNPGQATRRNNPGQDYNCRCQSRPILRRKAQSR